MFAYYFWAWIFPPMVLLAIFGPLFYILGHQLVGAFRKEQKELQCPTTHPHPKHEWGWGEKYYCLGESPELVQQCHLEHKHKPHAYIVEKKRWRYLDEREVGQPAYCWGNNERFLDLHIRGY